MWKAKQEAREEASPNDLYALLHLSPVASDEDIRKAYRQWAQIYHPDKYQDLEMKDVATENFQRIRDAYEILTDEYKRQIYDIYGMEGLKSGLELGTRLSKPEEIKEELERLRRRKEEEKMFFHARPSGSLTTNLSLPQYLDGGAIIRGTSMSTQLRLPLSKKTTAVVAGNLVVSGKSGASNATALLRHQVSPVASMEFSATAGLRSLLTVQTSRQISIHSSATTGFSVSLRDGAINLSNAWNRQLSEHAIGSIELVLGNESTIAVAWQKKNEKTSASGEVKVGTSSFGASAQYTHNFSSKSHGRVAGKIGNTALEFEIGGGRRISDLSTVRMLYNIGIQGISWKLELHRAGQKISVPVLLSTDLNAFVASSALLVPSSLYFLMKRYVLTPYYRRRERQKAHERLGNLSVKIKEAREAAVKAQKLLENVCNRKKSKQMEKDGLVITKALYGNHHAMKEGNKSSESSDEADQLFNVTVPLNFLITDSGVLKLHEGIKKSGIMGFYDPCPGEPNLLLVEYTFHGQKHRVIVGDYDELLLPQDMHLV